MLIAGPTSTLAIAGMKNSRSDLLATAIGADGAGAIGLSDGGVVKEEAVRDRFFLRSASGFAMYFFGREKPVRHSYFHP